MKFDDLKDAKINETVFVNPEGYERLYIGFTIRGKLVTSNLTGSNIFTWEEHEIKDWEIKQPEREKFYIWRYNECGVMKVTETYYSNNYRDTMGYQNNTLHLSKFKEICTEFRPIYSDGSYADE